MKVAAIIPDEIVKDVQEYTQGKNTTDRFINRCQGLEPLTGLRYD